MNTSIVIKKIWEKVKQTFQKIKDFQFLPNPQSVGDEALTWTSWAIVAGVMIPLIALVASVFIHPSSSAEHVSVLSRILKKVVDENLFLYFSIEIIIAAAADYYLLSLKSQTNPRTRADYNEKAHDENQHLTKPKERLLTTSFKYGAFPMIIFTIALVTLFIPHTEQVQVEIFSVHIIVFLTTILYVIMVKYRCGCFTEDCYNNTTNGATESQNGTAN